jgi:phenylpropionate dioxygenase-like ring-hydroxylating dioxygenase large terminal subunit
MDLPASVVALGEQLRGGETSPDPALFCDPDVFAAERQRIFQLPSSAIDHASRLAENGRYFRCDAAPRSLILTRDEEGRLRALRNLCLHAGYPLCDAEEGAAERLVCPYHGWEYTLTGRLVEPELSSRIDPARLQLASYPVWVSNGLILVDPSGKTDASEHNGSAVPAWLADAVVVRRARHNTNWNWKYLHQLLRASPHLFFAYPPDGAIEFGPLSLMFAQPDRAVLLRIVPRFAEQTDFHLIEMAAEGAPEQAAADGADAVADGLRGAAPTPLWFDRDMAEWYWSLMSSD